MEAIGANFGGVWVEKSGMFNFVHAGIKVQVKFSYIYGEDEEKSDNWFLLIWPLEPLHNVINSGELYYIE